MKKRVFHPRIKALLTLLAGFFVVTSAGAQTLVHGDPDSRLKPRPAKTTKLERAPLPHASARDEAVTAHLASYYSEEDALAGWKVLRSEFSGLLSPHQPILREIDLGARGRFVRLLAGPFEGQDDAAELCRSLRVQGAYCAVMDGAGQFVVSTKEWD